MANVRKGTNYEVDDTQIDFFGAKGVINGSEWMTNTLSTEVLTPVLKSSILPRIRKYIQNDVTAGKGHKIAMVQLAPRQAVVFFLEGMLTRKHFDAATEGSNYVDIPRVMIEGRSLTVRVRKDAEFTVATLDTEGKMV